MSASKKNWSSYTPNELRTPMSKKLRPFVLNPVVAAKEQYYKRKTELVEEELRKKKRKEEFELGYVYVGATMSDKSGDKSELPWFSNGNSLLSPLLSLIVAPT
jgi:hypothetical protein